MIPDRLQHRRVLESPCSPRLFEPTLAAARYALGEAKYDLLLTDYELDDAKAMSLFGPAASYVRMKIIAGSAPFDPIPGR